MDEKTQEIIDKLESLQYDILFWARKTRNEKVKEKLKAYDRYIESIIDDLLEE